MEEADAPTESNRVLFLLDGLDEISHFWDDDTVMKQSLHRLMQGPQTVIVTTRPYGTNMAETSKFDFKLKTIGFNFKQIESYVNASKIVPERKTAEQILFFIKSHPQIENVVRIPIQLDALCYIWGDSSPDEDAFQTMTAVYEAIVVSLLRKDAVKLGKTCNGRVVNQSTVAELSAAEICGLMSEEITLLEGLAFQDFYNGCIELSKTIRNKIHKHLLDQDDPLPQAHNSILRDLSFLRSSNEGSEEEDKQSFHFIHLTFQEYFAASYFVKYWLKSTELPCIELQNNRTIAITSVLPHIFLDQRKYTVRYNMVWRYVAGLLHARSDKHGHQLTKFFKHLEAEPRDLLGPSHRDLLTHCLGELPTSTASSSAFSKCKAKIERSLSRWLLLQCNMCWESGRPLDGLLDYPEHLIYTVFQQADFVTKMRLLSMMKRESRANHKILRMADMWVVKRHAEGQDLEEIGVKLIRRDDRETKLKVLDIIHDLVLKPISDFALQRYLQAAAILIEQLDLSPKHCLLETDVNWLRQKDMKRRLAASSFLFDCRQSLPPEVIHSLII